MESIMHPSKYSLITNIQIYVLSLVNQTNHLRLSCLLVASNWYKLISQNKLFETNIDNNYMICWAICQGTPQSTNIINSLLKHAIIDPSINNNEAVCLASFYGRSEILELLMSDPRVDPTVNDNISIACASMNGHPDTIKILLKNSKVDPTVHNNYALRMAIANKHSTVVDLLMKHPRVRSLYISNQS